MAATGILSSTQSPTTLYPPVVDRGHRSNDVAAILDQIPRTVDRLIAAGRLTATYPLGRGVGKSVFIADESLQRFLDVTSQSSRVASVNEAVEHGKPNEREFILNQLEDCIARVVAPQRHHCYLSASL